MMFAYLLLTFVAPALVLWTMVIVGVTTNLLKIWLVMQIWWALFMLAVSMADDKEER